MGSYEVIALAKETFELGPRGKAPGPLSIQSRAIRLIMAVLAAAVKPCGAGRSSSF